MAIGTSPAAGIFVSRSIQMSTFRTNRPRLLGALALAQLIAAGLLVVSTWPAAPMAAFATTAHTVTLSTGLQIACLAISAMLGCALVLIAQPQHTASTSAQLKSWSTILALAQESLPMSAPQTDGFAVAARQSRLPPNGSPIAATTAIQVQGAPFPKHVDFDAGHRGISGPAVARCLADAWTGLWGHQLFPGAFEIEAHRGRASCDTAVLRQSVMHLLIAAAAESTLCGSWLISIHGQQGERVAVIQGQTSASQFDRVLAKQIEASFAITLAEALLRQQGGSLLMTRGPSGRWTAVISLPQA